LASRLTYPLSLLVVTALAAPLTACGSNPTLTISGLAPHALLDADAAGSLVVRVAAHGASTGQIKARIDGRRLVSSPVGGGVEVSPGVLADGGHTLVVQAAGTTLSRAFTVDRTPPTLTVDPPSSAPSLRSAVTITGEVTGASRVSAGATSVPVTADHFALRLPAPPAALAIVATDLAGNTTTRTVSVSVKHPLMRGVHLTGYGWNDPGLRNPVLALARVHRINTVELDVKEEDGYVDFDTSVALAHRVHGVRVLYDPAKVVKQLHHLGIRVVGRIVCFRDPKLAAWAWSHHHRDWDVQAPNGKPYKSTNYGAAAFTNWASAPVRAYNIALATEAAKLGFDDVMFDYVRRPDGPVRTMRFPGARVSPPTGVAEFVKDASGPVRSNGAYLGLAVFGVSATRPKEVGQDIGAMARYVDYVAPMVYPSHWGPGEYGVANPNAQPYPIVNRSLKDFVKKVAGTTAQVMPWLQDFSLGVTYKVPQVKAQIVAAARDGIGSFLLWNAGCVYQGRALVVDKNLPRTTD
jgi:hypothetical protein